MKSKIFAVLATLSFSSLALAAEGRLVSASANGSGCPVQDGKDIPYSFDGQWLTLEVSKAFKVKVEKGTGISLEDSRKNCAVTLELDAPGYRYAVERVVAWGSYQLGANDQFVASLDGFFQGDGRTLSSSVEANGPTSLQNYNFDRTLGLVWSECSTDRALTLNSAVRVAPRANGKYTTASSGTLDRVAFRFVYQKC